MKRSCRNTFSPQSAVSPPGGVGGRPRPAVCLEARQNKPKALVLRVRARFLRGNNQLMCSQYSSISTFGVLAAGSDTSSVLSISSMRLCVWEMESGRGVRGKQGRLRSPFHLLHSEMKWPSQVCGGVGWREEGSGVLKHLISLSLTLSLSIATRPPILTKIPGIKKNEKGRGEQVKIEASPRCKNSLNIHFFVSTALY